VQLAQADLLQPCAPQAALACCHNVAWCDAPGVGSKLGGNMQVGGDLLRPRVLSAGQGAAGKERGEGRWSIQGKQVCQASTDMRSEG
jgi:hypothetical protein